MMNMLLNLRNVLTARELFTHPYLLHRSFRLSTFPLFEHTYTLWPSGRWAFSFLLSTIDSSSFLPQWRKQFLVILPARCDSAQRIFKTKVITTI